MNLLAIFPEKRWGKGTVANKIRSFIGPNLKESKKFLTSFFHHRKNRKIVDSKFELSSETLILSYRIGADPDSNPDTKIVESGDYELRYDTIHDHLEILKVEEDGSKSKKVSITGFKIFHEEDHPTIVSALEFHWDNELTKAKRERAEMLSASTV